MNEPPTRARYRFGPADSLALVGPARVSQCLVVLAGIGATLTAMYLLPVVLAPAAFIPLAGSAALAFLPVRGLPALDWLRLAIAAGLRRRRGHARWRNPLPTAGTDRRDGVLSAPPEWGRLRIVPAVAAGGEVGVLIDERDGTASATMLVRVEAFSLLSDADQERRVEAWGGVLAALARESHQVRRIAWTERTVPAEVDEIAAFFALARDRDGASPSAVQSYVELIDSSTAAALEHECFVSVQIDTRRRRREIQQRAVHGNSTDAATAAIVVDELRLVAAALAEAGVGAVGALPPRLLAAAIRHGVDPEARGHLARLHAAGADEGCAIDQAAPIALDERWDCVRADSSWNATYWVARWPLRDVGCLFLAPLLTRTLAQRTVALIAEPIPPSRAYREAERSVVQQEGDQVTRERHGFLQTARQRRRHQDILDREHELADGHALVRFSGYVTVTALARDELEVSCAEVVQAAQHAHLELRRLYGEQARSLAYTLPGLCRGLV